MIQKASKNTSEENGGNRCLRWDAKSVFDDAALLRKYVLSRDIKFGKLHFTYGIVLFF